MNRIEKTFSNNETSLITYTMAYDPDYKTSLEIMKGLHDAGADIIELGIPFSDPAAEGPIIQAAAERALKAGCTVKKVLEMVNEFRLTNQDTPIILMGYFNPIYRYGIENFVRDAHGVDGVIVVDLPPEEEKEFTDIAYPADLALIKLSAPTTDSNRAEVIYNNARGFAYYVSVAGITGVKSAAINDTKKAVEKLRKHTDLPIAVGFGIKTPEQAREIGEIADGVVVGSAIVKRIGDKEKNSDVFNFVRSIKESVAK